MTAKSITISVKGKRTIGDAGNDQIAALSFENGRKVEVPFMWTFPDGSTVLFKNAVVSVTSNGAGASTGVAPLELKLCQTASRYIQQPLKNERNERLCQS